MKRIIIANGIPIAYHITGKDYINYLNDAKMKMINPDIHRPFCNCFILDEG